MEKALAIKVVHKGKQWPLEEDEKIVKKRQTNNRQPAKALANKMTDNFSNSEQTET